MLTFYLVRVELLLASSMVLDREFRLWATHTGIIKSSHQSDDGSAIYNVSLIELIPDETTTGNTGWQIDLRLRRCRDGEVELLGQFPPPSSGGAPMIRLHESGTVGVVGIAQRRGVEVPIMTLSQRR